MSKDKNNNNKQRIIMAQKIKDMVFVATKTFKGWSVLALQKTKDKFFDIWGDFFFLLKGTTSTADDNGQAPTLPDAKKTEGMTKEEVEKIQQAIQDSMAEKQSELMFGKKLKEQVDSLVPSKRTIKKAKDDLYGLISGDKNIRNILLILLGIFLSGVLVLLINGIILKSSIIYWLFSYVVVACYSYFLGSTPSAYIIVRYNSNKDLRKIGSGNIGSTNVVRAAGYKWAAVTLFLDVMKAILAVVLTKIFFATDNSPIEYIAGTIAFVGHIYPFWLGFKGGKGVASAFGVIAFLKPIVGLIGFLAWLLSIATTRVSSLSSLIGAIFTLGAAYSFSSDDLGYFIMCVVMVGIIVFKHKSNIEAIYKGEEAPVKSNSSKDGKDSN